MNHISGLDHYLTTDPNDRDMTPDEIDDLVEDCIEQANGHIERLATSPDYHGREREYYEGILEFIQKEMEGTK